MAKIRQEDIFSGAISFTKSSSFAITSTVAYAQSNLTKTAFSIGTVGGMGTSDPIAIKEAGTDTNTGWSDEQDWTVYNQSFTTVIPVSNVAGGVAIYTTSTNASISIGDLVGIYGPGSWSTSGNLSIAKNGLAGAGSQNAALVAGGYTGGVGAVVDATELFNGSTWANAVALNQGRYHSGRAGSQNAALVAGGLTAGGDANSTELFNGVSWATSGVLSGFKEEMVGTGSQNAGLIAGGYTGAYTNVTELFNGSTWSTSGNLSAARAAVPAGAGSQNAGLIAGGGTPGVSNTTELFNGSSWSMSGVLSTAKAYLTGAGSQNAGLVAGGVTFNNTDTNATELFNGSSWSASGNLSAAKKDSASAGSQNAGLVAGGDFSSILSSVTELHNQTLYRKIVNLNELKSARSIGVAFDVTSTTLNVKFNGYINNINVTSSNSAISTAAQWVSKWVVLPRFSPNASTTNNPSSIVAKGTVEPEDFLVGWAISRTQMQVFSGNLYGINRINGW